MSNGTSIPVIAGLAVGIALVLTFAFIFNSTGNTQQILGQRRHGYMNISIQGLKTVYHVGENITFTEQITGYDSDCNGYPDINIEAIDHSHTIFTTYDRNMGIGCGDPDGNMPHMINLEYQSEKFFSSPIVADKAGKYILTATYAHVKVEKEFTVVNATVSNIATVIIPEGAVMYSSQHNNFEPETIKVVIGQNNTVTWVNHDAVMSSVVADDSSNGSAFYNATKVICENDDYYNCRSIPGKNFLQPNTSFEFTFTETGEYSYHGEPHPWMHGTVIVVDKEGHK